MSVGDVVHIRKGWMHAALGYLDEQEECSQGLSPSLPLSQMYLFCVPKRYTHDSYLAGLL